MSSFAEEVARYGPFTVEIVPNADAVDTFGVGGEAFYEDVPLTAVWMTCTESLTFVFEMSFDDEGLEGMAKIFGAGEVDEALSASEAKWRELWGDAS